MRKGKLSIIIPCYNEEATIGKIIEKIEQVKLPMKKEIIVVDESTDNSPEIVRRLTKKYRNIKLVHREKRSGKGFAIRIGLRYATGDIIIIQDADLEYDPRDYKRLIAPILKGKASVVYGSRALNPKNRISYFSFWLGGRVLTWMTNFLFRTKITDVATCYKVFDSKVIKGVALKCYGFEFCPEVTAKIAKRGIHIYEVPISYKPRKKEEGKKIKWTDGIIALLTLLRYRFFECD